MMSLREIADAAKVLLREGWTVTECEWCAKQEELCDPIPGTYVTDWDNMRIIVPVPLTPECLFIYLHEIGHALCQQPRSFFEDPFPKEKQASMWAKLFMEHHGMEVPPKIWQHAQKLGKEQSKNFKQNFGL